MEVGEVYIPEVSELDLANNQKFFSDNVRINGKVRNSNLIDEVTVYYIINNGEELHLPPMTMDGTEKNFTIDLTDLNLPLVVPHTIKVWSEGSTGLKSTPVERTFYITNLKEPTLEISETQWTKNDVTFKIIDTENQAQYVDKYQYKINSGNWVDAQKGTDIEITQQGVVTIAARIIGTVEGDSSLEVTATARIDKTPPTTTKPTATATQDNITVTLKQVDNESGINSSETLYSIKTGVSWGAWQTNNSFTGLISDTQYVVKTMTTDNVGNSSESEELTVKTLSAGNGGNNNNNNNDKDIPKDNTVADKDLPKTGPVVLIGGGMFAAASAIITFKKFTGMVLKP